MTNVFLGFLVFLSLQASVHAADKIRIGFPEFNSSTFTLPLAHSKGFFNEEGLQAELIRLRSAVVLPALNSGEIDYHTVVSPAVNQRLSASLTPLLVQHEMIEKLSEKIQIMVVPQGQNFFNAAAGSWSAAVNRLNAQVSMTGFSERIVVNGR